MSFGASVGMRLHRFGDALEVEDLTGVEILGELDVGAPDPPVVRQADREIAAVLRAQPAADAIFRGVTEARLAEHVVERAEPVVPVVVAGQHEQQTPPVAVGGGRQRRRVRHREALAVGGARRERIHLVAAHDQQLGCGQRADALEVDLRLADERGHRVGGIEAVAEVGDIVDPHRLAVAELAQVGIVIAPDDRLHDLRREAVDGRLHDALVGVLPENLGHDGSPAGADQMGGAVPAHHLGERLEIDLPRTVGHAEPPNATSYRNEPPGPHSLGTSLGWLPRGVQNGGAAVAGCVAGRAHPSAPCSAQRSPV